MVVAGVTSVTGATLGGIGLMLLQNYPDAQGPLFVLLAVGAILLAKNPNGLSIYVFRLGRWLQAQLAPRLLASLPQLDRGEDDDAEADEDPRHETTTASLKGKRPASRRRRELRTRGRCPPMSHDRRPAERR